MMIIFGIVVAYIVVGIAMEIGQELWGIKNAEKELGIKLAPSSGPIKERMKGYNLEWFKADVLDVLTWPYGFVLWYRGVKSAKADPEAFRDRYGL